MISPLMQKMILEKVRAANLPDAAWRQLCQVAGRHLDGTSQGAFLAGAAVAQEIEKIMAAQIDEIRRLGT